MDLHLDEKLNVYLDREGQLVNGACAVNIKGSIRVYYEMKK